MYQQQSLISCPPDANRIMTANNNGMMNYMIGTYPPEVDVKLKKLAFFDILATLVNPSLLAPTSSQRLHENSLHFTLTPAQATEIATNRDIRNASRVEHTVQVQLRFCLMDTTTEQDDYFPPNISVKVNGKQCQLPNPIPTNKPGVEPKRPPRPVNITGNVKLAPLVTNTIQISWCTEFNRGHVASIYLVRKLSSVQLLQRLKTKGIKAADVTRALIIDKLKEDADCEIATTMLRVSLTCPLGKMRMTTPCRASTCSHLQCFDACLYLQMNERKPTWNCPVCDKQAVYENLVIDGYFQEVIASKDLGADSNEIQLHNDGSWSAHVLKSDTQALDTPIKTLQNVEIISDDLVISTKCAKSENATGNQGAAEPSSTTGETVDLTLSDSDEDLPLKRKQNSGNR
ncbi:E3 SUMO-protein ligase PIAS1 isoform X2 [Phlebotomus argentipes]|uniref:E3 SUMO-protein ligase PIAS1 isoform X2 n=1 Tax=Phlebotomus argentipes TaxID=94469 RepID=UPI002892BC33|nr:E3 SUMO-protein ligase PIAS1 isoform X2 [Phlebotomus argentipes]